MAVADVAAKDGVVRVNGWREGGSLAADDLVSSLAEMGFRHLVFTDIARDGMLNGPNVDLYRRITAAWPAFAVQASGGVRELADVRAAAAAGCAGIVLGRALLEGRFALPEALAC